MKVDQIMTGNAGMPPKFEAAEKLVQDRQAAKTNPDVQKAETQLSSAELLDKIKALSQDGAYTVQFEMNHDIDSLVIRVVDRESGDVIRQIPSEEWLAASKALKDLRGLMVDTEF